MPKKLTPNFIKELFNNKGLSEQDLQAKMFKLLGILFAVVGVVVFIIIFYAPKIGFFFGLLSIHRNDKEKVLVIKPNPPFFINLPKAVKTRSVSLTGYAPAGSTVFLYVNGPERAKSIAGKDGLFNLQDVPLNDGKNTLSAKLIDTANIESEKTESFPIIVDTQKPKIELSGLNDGDTIKNLDKRIIIEGKVNESSSIKINAKTVVVKPDLTFEFNLGAQEGENKIKIEVTDLAGNITTKELKVTYQKKSI